MPSTDKCIAQGDDRAGSWCERSVGGADQAPDQYGIPLREAGQLGKRCIATLRDAGDGQGDALGRRQLACGLDLRKAAHVDQFIHRRPILATAGLQDGPKISGYHFAYGEGAT
jgi:hypothetical protein